MFLPLLLAGLRGKPGATILAEERQRARRDVAKEEVPVLMGVIDIVILSASVQMLLFAALLAVEGLRRRRELLYLALFFFSLAANTLNYFMFLRFDFFYPEWVHLMFLGSPFAYLYAPSLYLYIRRSAPLEAGAGAPRAGLAGLGRTLLHFLPFAAYAAYLCATFYFQDAAGKRNLMHSPFFLPKAAHAALTLVLQAQVLCYLVLGFRRLMLYRRRLKKSFSSIESINFSWLGKLAIWAAALWSLDLLRFAGVLADRDLWIVAESALWIVVALFCCVFLYNALRQPRVLFESVEEPARRPKKSLSDKTAGSYRRELERVMEAEKPHLEAELSLAGLADIAGIPARSLTEVIRASGSDNFYDFINDYRVREFIGFLADPVRKGETLLTLMFDAGFNSKSAFNRAFKKKTGRNPRQYLKTREG